MKAKKRIVISCLVLVVFLLAIPIGYCYWTWRDGGRNLVYPRVQIGNLKLEKLSYTDAQKIITKTCDQIISAGFIFQYRQKKATISAGVLSFDSGLSYPIFTCDTEASAKSAYSPGGHRTFLRYLAKWLDPRPTIVKATYSLDEKKLEKALKESFPELDIAPVDSYFSRDNKGNIKTNPETPGKQIDQEKVLLVLRNSLDQLNNQTIDLETRSQYPLIKLSDMEKLRPGVEDFIGSQDLSLEFDPQLEQGGSILVWTISPKKLLAWVSAGSKNGQPSLSLNANRIKDYLEKNVAPEINQEPLAPRFMMENGKVINWQGGKNGRELDSQATAEQIINNFLSGQKKASIITRELPNEKLSENGFNIKDLLGTGHSRFTGSPNNRRHNIKIGAQAVNGLLISPGEEFSLVKALGNVDASGGYLQELVIKGNKTTPEYGGGLCQIGTTIFRAALASGLPITARQNHSYRVSYYEPAGMDAAVYIPQPDVRFLNDTGNHVLIQARIVKDDLYFDFWGVSDGRAATTTAPIIYNIVKPEPMKTIVSPDLKPGEKKCTESSHNGADAYFDYTVIYPNGATTSPIQTRRFKSHYVPWRAVCLVGATSTASTSLDVLASSSSETASSSSSTKKAAQ